MASVYRRGKRWWVGFTDAAGVRRNESTKARTRDEAKKLAAELEVKHDRIRRGLDVDPGDPRLTFGQLFDVWWERHGARLASTSKVDSLRKHALPVLGGLVVREVTSARLELLFDGMSDSLTGSSVNTLRAQLRAIFGWAKKRGMWLGDNPAAATGKRKELEVERDELTADEVPLVLAEISPERRALAATAIGTGGRKGELGGLLVEDVDLRAGTIRFGRSWSRDTTKAGTSKTVPIAAWLRPYLEQAIALAKERGSEFVFSRPDGRMMREGIKLAPMLRRAMARAGLTRGWLHVCRRRGDSPCDFTERRDHNRVEACPKCGFRLWPKPIHRTVRWHDLRASTATLLVRGGASAAVTGRVLRHSDPSLTLKVYARVSDTDMRTALDHLVPGLEAPQTSAAELPEVLAAAVNAPPAAAQSLHGEIQPSRQHHDGPQALGGTVPIQALPARVERAASSFGGLVGPVGTPFRGGAQRAVGVSSRGVRPDVRNAAERGSSPFPASGAAPALQSLAVVPQLLTVRDVAARLSVSTATVYAIVERGELAHVRVSNAIRVTPEALAAYLERGR